MKQFERILVATDFSGASLPAWSTALTMAKEEKAVLFVVHAYEPPSVVQSAAVGAGVYEEWDRNLRFEVKKKLDTFIDEARKKGVQATPLAEAGEADEAIVKAAEDYRADLIVMGTHGRRGVSRIFLGSIASRVIATAPCPVLTLRSTEEKAFGKKLASASA